MKYDLLIFSSLPKNSGCYLRASYLGKSLTQNKLKIKVITPPESMPFMLDFVLTFFLNLYYVFKYKFKMGFAIKPYPNALIPLLIKKLFTNIKIGVDIDDIDFGYRKGIINTISRLIQKPFPKFFDIVTYHNPLLKKFIIQEYNVKNKKLFILPQGVDFDIYNYKTDIKNFKKRVLKKIGISSKTKIIIYAAHLNIAADLDIILENINLLLSKRDYFLIIAGGGPMFNFYKDYAKKLGIKKIYFTGYLLPKEIAKYVLLSDVAIVYYKNKPVNYYRCSMKLREYLALRKRVVSNDVGELKNFKKYVYQSRTSIDSFIKKIDWVLSKNFSDRREIAGYKFVKQNYNWKSIGKNFYSVILNFL